MSETVDNKQPQSLAPTKKHRGLRITLISLGSLLGLLLVAVVVALYLIFTPARLTSIVNKLSDKYILCESHFEKVDLSLFKTFPNAGLDVKDVVLINPTQGANSDTLMALKSLTVAINVRDFLKHRDIKVEKLLLDQVQANVYIASDGSTNFDIFPASDTTTTDTSSSSLPSHIDLKQIRVKDLSCDFLDQKDGMKAVVDQMDLKVDGLWKDETIDAQLNMGAKYIACSMRDSSGAESLNAILNKLDMALDLKGPFRQLDGRLDLSLPTAKVALQGTDYVTDAANASHHDLLTVKAPFSANLDEMNLSLSKASLSLVNYIINLDGDVQLAQNDRPMKIDAQFETNTWQVAPLLELLPPQFTTWQEGMDLDAKLSLKGRAEGSLTDTTMPLVTAHLEMDDGRFVDHSLLPYDLSKIAANLDADLDFGKAGKSDVKINSLSAVTGRNNVSLDGTIADLLGVMDIDANVKGNIQLPDLKPFFPDSLDMELKGSSRLDIHARTNLEQIQKLDIPNMKVDGKVILNHLDVRYDDITANSPQLAIDLQVPSKHLTNSFTELLSAKIKGQSLHAKVPSAGIDASLTATDLEASISNVLDEKVPFSVAAKGSFAKIAGTMDTIQASIDEPNLMVEMVPNRNNPAKVYYKVNYNSSSLFAKINDSLSINMAGLTIKGDANYDSTRANVLQQWSPDLDIDFKRGYINMSQLDYIVQVPDIKFNYKPERCEIASANVVFGNSDFYLSGAVTGLEKWISHEDMLKGELNFTSNYTNVDDLMDALSGLGSDEDSLKVQQAEVQVEAGQKDPNPFICPLDVDFVLHTRIKECTAFDNELQELAGDVMLRDGVAVLEQVGFVCKAARMQLTALYRTPRINHIFVGMDFHLLDINISELIDMIPYVDTLVPMLSAFEGRADFHLCAETYVDAYYKPKMSTLRGAAALSGDNLVVLDNETFNTIAKYMMFNKKTENVIDSLDVEMTVFRKEVELYPFLLSMDKYQLVASGRHNLDNNYDYHLEILKSPLPTRLALDVKGVMPKLGFALTKCRYADLYEPEKRGDLEKQTLHLKSLIRESLERNVKESTRSYEGLDNTK